MFDTFESFDERDVQLVETEAEKNFFEVHSSKYVVDDLQIIRDKMKYSQNLVFCKGWFPESAINVNDEFVFVNLDTDLYRPTYDGLNYFYARLVKGGFIMVHDYNNMDGVKQAVRQFSAEVGVNYVQIMDNGGSVVFAK